MHSTVSHVPRLLWGVASLVFLLAPVSNALASTSGSGSESYKMEFDGEGARAFNSGQAWELCFDESGFSATPASGEWSWGLDLRSYGFAGEMQTARSSRQHELDGARLTCAWDGRLDEWYINDGRGLEHGFTLRKRPQTIGMPRQGDLTLSLEIRGDWQARISSGARDVTFVNRAGPGLVDYAGLCAFDSEGMQLEARFELQGERLQILVDEREAVYPITIDPVAQELYIKPSNTEAFDFFGTSVALSGDRMVIGAVGEDSPATGVGGAQELNTASNSGAAYVFVRQGNVWVQEAYLKASNTQAGDGFGFSVGISADLIVVGANFESSQAVGVNGDESDNSAMSSGAAYVFRRQGSTWVQEAYLKASNTDALDGFGWTVAVSGQTVAVGAYEEQSNASGVNGTQSDNSLNMAGAVYVFVHDGNNWSQEAYLKPAQIDSNDHFGWSLALHMETLVVGSNLEGSAAIGVNGDDTDNSAPGAGAAYVFTRSGTSWTQSAYLKASNTDPGDRFACGLDYSGGLLVVGSSYEDSNAGTIDGDQNDNSTPSAGSAYIFEGAGANWTQVAYLKAPDPDARDHFGSTLAVSGEKVVIGALDEDSKTRGINGDMYDNSIQDSGAVYVFEKVGVDWTLTSYVKPINSSAFQQFGQAIDLEGETLLVGASGDQSAATGTAGDPFDDTAPAAGAAFLFALDAPETALSFCFGDGSSGACPCGQVGVAGAGCPNTSSSGARLSAFGQASTLADNLQFFIDGSTPDAPGLLLQGSSTFGASGVPAGNGLLCVQGHKRWTVLVTDSTGAASYGPDLFASHPAATPGATLQYQWWYRDLTDPCGGGFNFSNAVAVTWE